MSLQEVYRQRYVQTQKDKALQRLDQELESYDIKCQKLLHHRVQDWEKQHLIWKQNPIFEEPKKPCLENILYREPMVLTVGMMLDLRCLLG